MAKNQRKTEHQILCQLDNKTRSLFLLVAALCVSLLAADESPYTGEESRDIKALSALEIDGYLAGSGMGFAKAAELNGYPGPLHVLELAEELGLSEAQLQQTQGIYDAMKSKAVALGQQLVAKERGLDREFASGAIDADSLEKQLTEIALLEGQLRRTHLAAHLEQRKLLSQQQVQLYNQLRGYSTSAEHDAHRGH